MKKITLLTSAIMLSATIVFGQNNRHAYSTKMDANVYKQKSEEIINNAQRTPDGHIRCVTEESEKLKAALDPNYQTEAQFENWITQKIKDLKSNPNYGVKATRNIPVVVHVLYNNSTQNVSLAQVQDQIRILNEDYSATNADFSSVPSAFTSAAASMDIQFCLAQTDPSGNSTDGVDRISIPVTSVSDVDIETNYGLNNMWDPTKYLNIFVANVTGGLLGKAVFPTGSGLSGMPGGSAPTYDGVMIGYTAFGSIGTAQSPYNLGRSASHEIGHWLGLRHVWGEDGAGGCSSDDYCNDTPNQSTANYNCPSFPSSSCSGTVSDAYMDYMDYVPDACMYMFTNDQKARMDAVLLNSPQRKELLTSTVCGAAALAANFTESATTINVGQTITFTDASTGPNTITSWNWNFDVTSNGGVSPATMNTQGAHVVTYNNAGTYTVSLQVGDGSTTDTQTKTAYITVNAAGTVTCDSTAANWDWNTENFGPATWALDVNAAPFVNDGYILGNNAYDDNGWASKVSFSGTGKELTDVLYVFVQSSGTGVATLKVWDADGTGKDLNNTTISTAPGTIMAQNTVTSGQFSANLNQFVAMPISPAVALTGDFYIGYDHPAAPSAGDTLVMGVATGTSGNQVWANESGIGFRDVEYWGSGAGGNGTALNYKGTVVAVICDISTGEQEILGQLNNVLVYPNPSVGTLNVALTEKTNSTVTVLNMLGEVVASQTKNTQIFTFDINNHPNGVYFIRIKTGDKVTTKKVLLTK